MNLEISSPRSQSSEERAPQGRRLAYGLTHKSINPFFWRELEQFLFSSIQDSPLLVWGEGERGNPRWCSRTHGSSILQTPGMPPSKLWIFHLRVLSLLLMESVNPKCCLRWFRFWLPLSRRPQAALQFCRSACHLSAQLLTREVNLCSLPSDMGTVNVLRMCFQGVSQEMGVEITAKPTDFSQVSLLCPPVCQCSSKRRGGSGNRTYLLAHLDGHETPGAEPVPSIPEGTGNHPDKTHTPISGWSLPLPPALLICFQLSVLFERIGNWTDFERIRGIPVFYTFSVKIGGFA